MAREFTNLREKMSKSLHGVIDNLLSNVHGTGVGTDGEVLRHYKNSTAWVSIPDRYKPGFFISQLSKEDRETLQKAKQEDFNHRIK